MLEQAPKRDYPDGRSTESPNDTCRTDQPLLAYGLVSGAVAVGAGSLAGRAIIELETLSRVAAVVTTAVLTATAGYYADPAVQWLLRRRHRARIRL
jgi:hypothetical protein